MSKIITIGREFGSGGREFGRRLAERLGVAYYDQEIITEIAARTELSEKYVQFITESGSPIHYRFPIQIRRSFQHMNNPVFEQQQSVYLQQQKIIQEMAEKSDCLIVGRCGDYILKEQQPFRSIFANG